MNIELRMIDGRPFIVQRHGKKEFTRTPAEVIEIENRQIADGMAAVADAQSSMAATQKKIEAALLANESTVALRAQLCAEQEVIDGFTSDIGESREAIRLVWNLVDGFKADLMRKADADRLSQIASQHSDLLQESAA